MNANSKNAVVSCGGVVIYRNKVLLLYKNQNGRYMGWVMPKGNLEPNESYKQAALREVKEESGVSARVLKYLGKTGYTFKADSELLSKTVHWYLMTAGSFYCKPQAEEFFADVGFYKQHEAYHLLKFHDERQIMRRAFSEYGKQKIKHNPPERTKAQ
ncbi:MAG: NUDIX hydrolase [Defluviitaleaceae bacterium]|nr:NUDIX hydrolase [Defluviitaleaceae bacterium]